MTSRQRVVCVRARVCACLLERSGRRDWLAPPSPHRTPHSGAGAKCSPAIARTGVGVRACVYMLAAVCARGQARACTRLSACDKPNVYGLSVPPWPVASVRVRGCAHVPWRTCGRRRCRLQHDQQIDMRARLRHRRTNQRCAARPPSSVIGITVSKSRRPAYGVYR